MIYFRSDHPSRVSERVIRASDLPTVGVPHHQRPHRHRRLRTPLAVGMFSHVKPGNRSD
jgi:hypothetical protein